MKKYMIVLVSIGFLISLACQALAPKQTDRDGTVIADCASIVRAMDELQQRDPPKQLMETGIKQGDEFDANEYFKVLSHLSMQEGYTLDYFYASDFLGSSPYLYSRPVDQTPYASSTDFPGGPALGNYYDHIEMKDVEQGYFEYVVMNIMAPQFYLVWHANYNDTQIVCEREAADAIVEQINAGDFGMKMDATQQAQIRSLANIEPLVKLTGDSAVVEIVTFTKWGGFFRRTYTISRAFPHTVEMKEENVVEYECGIMF
jgi:hypothetical protein